MRNWEDIRAFLIVRVTSWVIYLLQLSLVIAMFVVGNSLHTMWMIPAFLFSVGLAISVPTYPEYWQQRRRNLERKRENHALSRLAVKRSLADRQRVHELKSIKTNDKNDKGKLSFAK